MVFSHHTVCYEPRRSNASHVRTFTSYIGQMCLRTYFLLFDCSELTWRKIPMKLMGVNKDMGKSQPITFLQVNGSCLSPEAHISSSSWVWSRSDHVLTIKKKKASRVCLKSYQDHIFKDVLFRFWGAPDCTFPIHTSLNEPNEEGKWTLVWFTRTKWGRCETPPGCFDTCSLFALVGIRWRVGGFGAFSPRLVWFHTSKTSREKKKVTEKSTWELSPVHWLQISEFAPHTCKCYNHLGRQLSPDNRPKMAPLEATFFVNNVLFHVMQIRRGQCCSRWKLLMLAAFGSDQVWIRSVPQTWRHRSLFVPRTRAGASHLVWIQAWSLRSHWLNRITPEPRVHLNTASVSESSSMVPTVWAALPPLNDGLPSAWVVIHFISLHFVVTNQKYVSRKMAIRNIRMKLLGDFADGDIQQNASAWQVPHTLWEMSKLNKGPRKKTTNCWGLHLISFLHHLHHLLPSTSNSPPL